MDASKEGRRSLNGNVEPENEFKYSFLAVLIRIAEALEAQTALMYEQENSEEDSSTYMDGTSRDA